MSVTISVSLPRCRSVAILLSVATAGSYDVCLHEPTVRPYSSVKYPKETAGWFVGGFPDFEAVDEFIRRRVTEGQAVFIKDMAFSAASWLLDSRLWDSVRRTVVLWIRQPYAQLRSFYAATAGELADSDILPLCDYTALLRLYDALRNLGVMVLIADSDELVAKPEAYMGRLTELLGVRRFGLAAWSPASPGEMRERWAESKTSAEIERWHGSALRSRGVSNTRAPPGRAAVDHRVRARSASRRRVVRSEFGGLRGDAESGDTSRRAVSLRAALRLRAR